MRRPFSKLQSILWWQVTARVMRLILKPRPASGLVALGQGTGRWFVPESALNPGAIAYLGGAGDNITFDIGLWQEGVEVRVFDPTPLAIAHVESTAPDDDRFVFVRKGWWNEATSLTFFAGPSSSDVSFSATNMFHGESSISLPVNTIAGCMKELGDDRVDIVKIDIEGAEKVVLRSMLSDGLRPSTLCVEFDRPLRGVVASLGELRAAGYVLLNISGWNYTFRRSQA